MKGLFMDEQIISEKAVGKVNIVKDFEAQEKAQYPALELTNGWRDVGISLALGKSVGACVRPPPSVLSPPGGSFALALLLLSTLCT